jgi:LytS/YehU family sensor histidine kinase
MRASSQLKINTRIDKETLNGQLVYPLLFLPLVENAFKYVGGDYGIDINMNVKDHNIHLHVENNIPEGIRQSSSPGIGLENLQRRLELLYPGRYEFSTRKENNKFIADLSIEQL